jgi:hypothetical protein
MNPMPGKCPVCNNTLTVTRLQCGQCGTGIDGSFRLGRLQSLTAEQAQFLEVFVKNRGKIKDVEAELGISYPTVVGRLNDLVRAMGYDVDDELSEVDQFEYYQAQALNPARIPSPPMPAMPPMAPMVPAPMVPAPKISPEKRQQILDDLKAGKITAAEAQKKLHG